MTSDGHGDTLITDPPVTSGGSVTNTEISSGGASTPDFASTPPLQWLENAVEAVVSDLEGLKGVSGFEQLLNRIEGWCSSGSGSTPTDQTSDHASFQAAGFAGGWQSHLIQTLASFGDGKGGPCPRRPGPAERPKLAGTLKRDLVYAPADGRDAFSCAPNAWPGARRLGPGDTKVCTVTLSTLAFCGRHWAALVHHAGMLSPGVSCGRDIALRGEAHALPDTLVQPYDLLRLVRYFDHDRITLLGCKIGRPLSFAAHHEVVAITVAIGISLERKP